MAIVFPFSFVSCSIIFRTPTNIVLCIEFLFGRQRLVQKTGNKPLYPNIFLILVYIILFIVHKGLTMYSILPRHHFSNVQCALFPKFVRYCLIFSTLSLVSYYLIISSISSESLLSKVSNLLYK